MSDNTLGEEEWQAIGVARRALVKSLTRQFPPRLANQLTAVAICGAFADMCAASAGRDDLIAIINQQLAGAGLELRPVARN